MALVTMFTDASFTRKHNRGTWAAWAKMNGETMRRSGILKATLTRPELAELCAIANGLVALRLCWAEAVGPRVIIQTDCKGAIDRITGMAKSSTDTDKIVLYIRNYVKAQGWSLDLRHVKGHKGMATPRNAVNTFCDEECRRQMGILLRSLRSTLELVVDNNKVA
jgi:ribonuclease HI